MATDLDDAAGDPATSTHRRHNRIAQSVTLSHANMVADAAAVPMDGGNFGHEKMLAVLPFHSYGMALSRWAALRWVSLVLTIASPSASHS